MSDPPADLSGKRVLVLGGETALGRALAVALAEAGVDVAIATLSSTTEAEFAVNSAANELWALGRKGLAVVIDASDEAQLREALRQAEHELGRMDLAVAPDAGAGIDLGALSGREVIELAAGVELEEALREVGERLVPLQLDT